jgi:Tfp pilus assembly protein PilP
VSSRTARAIQRNPVSKNKKQNKTKPKKNKKKKEEEEEEEEEETGFSVKEMRMRGTDGGGVTSTH